MRFFSHAIAGDAVIEAAQQRCKRAYAQRAAVCEVTCCLC